MIIGFLALFFFFGRDDKRESNGVVWNDIQKIQKTVDVKYIAVPGIDELYFTANETNQKVNLYNPDMNTCSMNMSIELSDGDIIWSMDNIQPGYGIYDIELNEELENGIYENTSLIIKCFTMDGVELNGGRIRFILYVN